MLISTSHKFVYVPITKNASTTMRRVLFPYFDEGQIRWTNGEIEKLNRWNLNAPYHGGHPDHFKFAIVRNPYARLVSYWRHKRRGRNHELTFSDFVQSLHLTKNRDGKFRRFAKRQVEWIFKNGEITVDKLYDFDDMDYLFEDVGSRIGVTLPKAHERHFGDYHWEDCYTDELREIVRTHFQDDFALLEGIGA